MLKQVSIKTKIHIPILLAISIGMIVITATSYQSVLDMKEDVYKTQKKVLEDRVTGAIGAKNKVWMTNAMQLAKNEKIVDAFLEKDRASLKEIIGAIGKLYRENTPFKKVNVELIDMNLISQYKSWKPESFGQKLSYSDVYKEAIKSKKLITSYEESPKGLRLKSLFPMEKNGEIVGFLIFSGGINSFGSALKKEGIDFLYFLDKKYASMVAKKVKSKDGHLLSATKNIDKKFSGFVFSNKFSLAETIRNGFSLDEEYFVVSVPMKDFSGEIVGHSIVSKPMKVIDATIDEAISALISQVIIMAVIDVLLLVFIAIMLSKAVIGPINKLVVVIKDLVEGEGDLTKRLNYELTTKDELGDIALYVDQFIDHMHTLIQESKENSNENVVSAEQVTSRAKEMGVRAQKNSEVTNEANSKTEEIKNFISESVDESNKTKSEIVTAQNELTTAKDHVEGLSSIVSRSVEKEQELTDKLNSLNSDVGQIKDVLTIISDIAEQTNLLALNAAIEAARAGEHGRGFAVVADEVRKLAERTQKSLAEINSSVNLIVQSIMEASESMNKNMDEINELHSVTEEVGSKIDSVSNVMNSAVDSSIKSQNISEEIKSHIEEVMKLMETVKTNSNDDSRSIQDIVETSGNLKGKVEHLNKALDHFKV